MITTSQATMNRRSRLECAVCMEVHALTASEWRDLVRLFQAGEMQTVTLSGVVQSHCLKVAIERKLVA